MARIVELILTTELTRGAGKEGDPIRAVPQLWTKNGELVAEHDMYTGESFFVGVDSKDI